MWRSACLKDAHAEMVAEGVHVPGDSGTWPELYQRGEAVRAKFADLDRLGYYGWLLAMCGGAGTAIGLMIAFPKQARTTPIDA